VLERASLLASTYIAVEGVIGVGKTTLVNALAERMGARAVFEQFDENPFLPDFYRDREAFAFSTQIFFLMSRFRQQELLAQGDLFRSITLSDYCFDKDRIFALINLRNQELALYERLFEVLRVQVPEPDLIIYLRAELDVIMERIAERDRPYERGMDPGYIREVAAAYGELFGGFDACPVLTIDTSELDLRRDSAAVDAIEDAIRAGRTELAQPMRAREAALPLPGFG